MRIVPLFADLCCGGAQRCIGNLNQTAKRSIEFEDQEKSSRNGQCTEDQNSKCSRMSRREQTETRKDDDEPKDQHHDQGVEIDLPRCSYRSQRFRPISTTMSNVCD